jgi:hypothetical protein
VAPKIVLVPAPCGTSRGVTGGLEDRESSAPTQGDRSVAGCGFGAVKEVDAMGEPASGRGRPEAAYRW